MATADARGKITPAEKKRSSQLQAEISTRRALTHDDRDELLKFFNYYPGTGALTNRINRGRAKAGAVAGTKLKIRHGLDYTGYWRIRFRGELYLAHAMILLMEKNEIVPPGMEVHHKNGIGFDNRIDNLEIVTHSENMRQTKRHRAKAALPKAKVASRKVIDNEVHVIH